ncbi:YveK family protein [Jeotgalibacillus malaysiensis]|uniref:YveK family protein n=1 Tax=Jeotgalibacillus malaysiensis TaxID=1508404 RepID=UPI00384E3DBC
MNQKSNGSYTPGSRDINLLEYIQVIKKRLILIILLAVAFGGLAYYYNNLNYSPLYQTSTRVIITSTDVSMKTLMVMMKDPTVMDQVAADLGIDRSPQALSSQVTVEQLDESQVVSLSVTDSDPELAAAIANATAANFKVQARSLLAFEAVQLLTEAQPNYGPINPISNRTVYMAAAAGFALGIGLAFFMDTLDNAIRKEEEIETYLGIPVIGKIPDGRKKKVLKQPRKKVTPIKGGETIDIAKKAVDSGR